jgi:cytochrome b involved in lipid metabolism
MIAKKALKWNTKYVIWTRRFHRLLALVFWVFSLVVMTTGIGFHINDNLNAMPKYGFLVPLNIILMIVITATLEVRYQRTWRKEDPFVYGGDQMTEEEFEKRVKNGEKLVILDNMVIDIGTYAYAHPGGAFLLEYNVGRDISKFFYGGYALDGNGNDPSKQYTERYAHSNMARKIANNNRIGTLKLDAVRWCEEANES